MINSCKWAITLRIILKCLLCFNNYYVLFVLFHAKNKPIPENFDCIHTTFITLNRVKCVQYLGLMIDENLYWHMHVEHVYNSLVKYFGIFNHVKTIISKKIARQLYFCFYTFSHKIWNWSLWRLCEWIFTKTASNTKQTFKTIIKFWPTNFY